MKRNTESLDLSQDMLNILQTSGRSRGLEDFPVLEIFRNDAECHPFIKTYTDSPLNHVDLMKELENFNPTVIFLKEEIDCKSDDSKVTYSFVRLQKGYFLEISSNLHVLDDYDEVIHDYLRTLSNSDNYAYVSYVTLLCPPNNSSLYNKNLEDKIYSIVKKNRLKRNTTTPSIGMICQEDGDFYIKDFYIKTEYKIIEGDLHYGKGFMNFHEQLLNRFKEDKKGLVLFHGEPGTGKTYYIRTLMKELISIDKFIIYLPPNMMDFMVSPEMISYISQVVMDKYEDGKSCIILLEDAEPLIASRKSGNRSDGITNLLNMTDGLLNDMLNVQVIATFNTDLKNIDDALLRPERLIARKEFKKLTKEDAKILAEFLKIEKDIDQPCTLAQLYSQHKQKEILVHEYNEGSGKIGFRI